MNIRAGLLGVALLAAWIRIPAASAHLPQLFGLEYIRAEPPLESARSGEGSERAPGEDARTGDATDGDTLLRRIAESEYSTGPYAPGLADPLVSLGLLHHRRGDFDDALAAYQRALHVIRVNDGLTSEYQIPALRRLMGLYRDLGDYARLHDAYVYLLRLRAREGPPYGAAALDDSIEYFQWQRQSYAAPGGARRDSHLLQAYRENGRMLAAMAARADEEPEGYRRLVFSQIHNLYLILGIDPSRLHSGGISLEQDSSDEAAREHLLRVQEVGVYEGKNLLLGLIERSLDARPEALAALHLELGDWYQWNESPGRAREQYEEVFRLLREAGREDLLARWLDAPVELPDERETWLRPAAPEKDRAVVVARYRVTERGNIRDLETRLRDGDDGSPASRIARMLRDTHFRPRFSAGRPQLSEEVTRHYMLVE